MVFTEEYKVRRGSAGSGTRSDAIDHEQKLKNDEHSIRAGNDNIEKVGQSFLLVILIIYNLMKSLPMK